MIDISSWDWDIGKKQVSDLDSWKKSFSWIEEKHASPDGEKILSTGEGGCLSIWDAQSGDEKLSLQDYSDPRVPDCSSDGVKITASIDEFVIVWDAQMGEQLLRKTQDVVSWAVSYSPDGGRIAATSNNSIKHLT